MPRNPAEATPPPLSVSLTLRRAPVPAVAAGRQSDIPSRLLLHRAPHDKSWRYLREASTTERLRPYFPRVAVTVTDWSRNDCWIGSATICGASPSPNLCPPFGVLGQSVGCVVNNAANLHLFMQQTAVEHSGNVRTVGPKPPMLAIPDRQPISERQQLAFQGLSSNWCSTPVGSQAHRPIFW